MIVNILLMILKVIGIILLTVIGLILLVLLLLCISPIRYRVDGSYYEKPNGRVVVSWLLHILHVRGDFTDGELSYKVRVFGIPVIRSDKKKEPEGEASEEGKVPEEKPAEEEKTPESGGTAASNDEKEEVTEPEAAETDTKVEEIKTSEESADAEETAEDAVSDGSGTDEASEDDTDWLSFIDKMNDAWYEKKEKIFEKIDELEEKYRDIKKKLRLITNERTEAAIAYVMKKVFGILKGIMPKKMRGHIRFGLENPADTGTVLAVLAATMPVHKNNLKVEPDFTEKALEGEAWLKGRIWIGSILFAAVCILLNRNVRITIKRFKKHFSSK